MIRAELQNPSAPEGCYWGELSEDEARIFLGVGEYKPYPKNLVLGVLRDTETDRLVAVSCRPETEEGFPSRRNLEFRDPGGLPVDLRAQIMEGLIADLGDGDRVSIDVTELPDVGLAREKDFVLDGAIELFDDDLEPADAGQVTIRREQAMRLDFMFHTSVTGPVGLLREMLRQAQQTVDGIDAQPEV